MLVQNAERNITIKKIRPCSWDGNVDASCNYLADHFKWQLGRRNTPKRLKQMKLLQMAVYPDLGHGNLQHLRPVSDDDSIHVAHGLAALLVNDIWLYCTSWKLLCHVIGDLQIVAVSLHMTGSVWTGVPYFADAGG